jgi:hypothetical protein
LKVLDVEIKQDLGNEAYLVKYYIETKEKLIRKSTATFANGTLSRDNDNAQLVEMVKTKIKLMKGK